MKSKTFSIFLCLCVLYLAPLSASSAPVQPGPPSTGPGANDYQFNTVTERQIGEGARKVVVFTPDYANLERLPIVVFFHGYSGVNPRVYDGWIEHTVKRGAVLLYPVYQEGMRGADNYTQNAVDGLLAALNELGLADSRRVVFVGHSLGCVIAANVADLARSVGIPQPRALLLANAGDTNAKMPFLKPILRSSLDSIPSTTLVLAVVGGDDSLAGEKATRAIFSKLGHISLNNREVLQLNTDNHGEPALSASHNAPLSSEEEGKNTNRRSANAFDYNGYWKWADALLDASCYGKNREYALGGSQKQLSLGEWSDGTPIKQASTINITEAASEGRVGRSETVRERIKKKLRDGAATRHARD